METLAVFNIKDICLRPGKSNVLDDAPSRIPSVGIKNIDIVHVDEEQNDFLSIE